MLLSASLSTPGGAGRGAERVAEMVGQKHVKMRPGPEMGECVLLYRDSGGCLEDKVEGRQEGVG